MYNVAHFIRHNSRGRAKMENKQGKNEENISILIHPSSVSVYIFEIDAAGNYHSQKVYWKLSV